MDDSKMTATPLTRVLGILGIVAGGDGCFGVIHIPPDVVQVKQRMLYLHVPPFGSPTDLLF